MGSHSSVRTRHTWAADALSGLAAAALLAAFLWFHGRISADLTQAASVAVGFAVAARLLRGVDDGGAFAGAIVAFLFYSSGGWQLFVVLLVVFAITLVATIIGSDDYRQGSQGRRATQIMANLLVPSILLLLHGMGKLSLQLAIALVVAALAELAADTVSGEIGEAFGYPTYMLTTLRRTQAGLNGGISLTGTAAGVAATVVVAGVAKGLFPGVAGFGWAAFAGLLGMLVDSLLGAVLENRGLLSNETVNLLSTAAAAGFAWLLIPG